jgi:hypothetical protein
MGFRLPGQVIIQRGLGGICYVFAGLLDRHIENGRQDRQSGKRDGLMHDSGAGTAKRPQIACGRRQGHIVGHAQSRLPRRAAFEAVALVKPELRPGRGARLEIIEEITSKDEIWLPVSDRWQRARFNPAPDRALGGVGDVCRFSTV